MVEIEAGVSGHYLTHTS